MKEMTTHGDKMNEYRVYWTTKCGQKFENYLEADDNDIGLGHALFALLTRTDGKNCSDCIALAKWGRGGKGIKKITGTFCPARGLPEMIKEAVFNDNSRSRGSGEGFTTAYGHLLHCATVDKNL